MSKRSVIDLAKMNLVSVSRSNYSYVDDLDLLILEEDVNFLFFYLKLTWLKNFVYYLSCISLVFVSSAWQFSQM